jgi:hypothetical protein
MTFDLALASNRAFAFERLKLAGAHSRALPTLKPGVAPGGPQGVGSAQEVDPQRQMTAPPPGSHALSDPSCILTVQSGVLELPANILTLLSLRPGDLLSTDVRSSGLLLEPLASLFSDGWMSLSSSLRRRFLDQILQRPLLDLKPGGRLHIPLDLMPLKEGAHVLLLATRVNRLYLFAVTPPEVKRS